ncbi:MAG: hypothetical protein XD76_0708 [candidate division TA06 bacterium 32_111]|uniref:Uncharacterized protein n=2 Tax=Bacteria candidate phyla TaxID=1783234 RepID=A0A117M736_UNCT6|nr:MAG: hypothetical protein XD76_0708 [candidate division TA06 bacterium 32_111]KUK87894.1 MAG: hypothetical protein XE03_0413 [candidate division TA06 bacterium 34_109]HAF08047.1 hypothetical protein [candidate division WOR-3 bacterium]HCP16252.1 hypothetical protein [candidate division WOR-3 bacterium]
MKRFIFLFISIFYIFIFSTDLLSIFPTPIGEGGKGAVLTFSSTRVPLFFYNPSNSSNIFKEQRENFSFFYEHKFLFSNISNYNNFSILFPEIKRVSLGVQVINQNIDDIPIYPEYSDSISFIPAGYFSDNSFAGIFNFSYSYSGKDFYELNFGGNIKTIYHRIYKNVGVGFGVDLGTTFKLCFDNFKNRVPGIFALSFVYRDIAKTRVVWDTDSNTVSLINDRFFSAISYEINIQKIRSKIFSEFSFDIGSKIVSSSIIYTYSDLIGFNLGYKHILFESFNPQNIGFGIFLNITKFSIYYSFTMFDIGNSNSLGISYSF